MCAIPGVDEVACWTFLAEGGFGCKAFGSAGQFASWAGVCPGNHQSAGTRKRVATLKGNRYLRRMLVQCAWAGSRKKDSFFKVFYARKTARLGPLKALVALAHRDVAIKRVGTGGPARRSWRWSTRQMFVLRKLSV